MENKRKTVYDLVNDIILGHLKKGVVPWRKTWIDRGLPKNLITKRPYRGINLILLNLLDFPTNFFLTYKQIKDVGGFIKKGESPHMVIFWKWVQPVKDKTVTNEEDLSPYPILQYHNVWNVAQCEKIPEGTVPYIKTRENDLIDVADKLIESITDMPRVQYGGARAYYQPKLDLINMPEKTTFEKSEFFYSTFFHELVHSTGHEKRLNRKGVVETIRFGTELYSFEELIAEIGACYLLSHCGIEIDNFSNNAAYIEGWLERLGNNRDFFIHASVQAQKASDFLLGVKAESNETAQTNVHANG